MITFGGAGKAFQARHVGIVRLCRHRRWASINITSQSGQTDAPRPFAQRRAPKSRHASRAYQMSKNANIGSPTELRKIQGQDVKYCVYLSACDRHTWHPYVIKYLDFEKETPYTDMVIAKSLAKHHDPLWFYAQRCNYDKLKPVVLKKATAKAHAAFRAALQANGYDSIGRKMPGFPDGSTASEGKRPRRNSPIQELYGTVRIMMRPLELVQAPFEEVVERLARGIANKLQKAIGREIPTKQRAM